MYNSGKFSDVVLKVGEKVLPAHKAILASRSKVFADMISDMQGIEIFIEDVDSLLMESVLQYIYTGRIEELTVEKAIHIFPIATKFSLPDLQKCCVAVMLANLSVENVCRVAILGDMHSISQIKSATFRFFCKYQDKIFPRKEWDEICKNNRELASEILRALSKSV